MSCQSLPQPSGYDLLSPTVLLLWRRESGLASSSPSRFLTGGPRNEFLVLTWLVWLPCVFPPQGRVCEAALPVVAWVSGLRQIFMSPVALAFC